MVCRRAEKSPVDGLTHDVGDDDEDDGEDDTVAKLDDSLNGS